MNKNTCQATHYFCSKFYNLQRTFIYSFYNEYKIPVQLWYIINTRVTKIIVTRLILILIHSQAGRVTNQRSHNLWASRVRQEKFYVLSPAVDFSVDFHAISHLISVSLAATILYTNLPLLQWFWTQRDLYYPGTSGNVWRHCDLSQPLYVSHVYWGSPKRVLINKLL